MRRLVPLLVLLAAAVRAQTISFGPERELVPARRAAASGRIEFGGAATDGERVLLVWTKFDYGSQHVILNYASLSGQRPIALPTDEQAAGAVWSGSSFFIVTRGEEGGHLIPLSSGGRLGAPRELGLKMGVFRSASNGNGFLVASAERGTSLHARLFDRDGKLLRDLGQIDEPLSAIQISGSDYIAGRLIVHRDGSHELRPETLLDTYHTITPSDPRHVPPERDGSTYLVFSASGVRRYSAGGTLLESTPGQYEWPQAIVPRKNKPPFLVWLTKDMALRTNDDSISFERMTDETWPRASSDGASTIVAWRDASGLAATVFGSLDEPRRIAELPGSPRTAKFSTMSLRGVHYVVWCDADAVRMLRLDANGSLLDAVPVTVAKTGEPSRIEDLTGPGLATNGRDVLAVWTDGDAVRGATIARDGTIGTPFAIASANSMYRPFAPAAAVEDRDYAVYWIEASVYQPNDHLPLPYMIRSAAVHDGIAQPVQTVVPTALYPQRLSLSPGRVLWAEYCIWVANPLAPAPREPSFIVLQTVARPAAGEPVEIVRMPRMTWNDLPAVDVAALPLDGGALAVWSERGALMAMPLDENYKRAGDSRQIGEALNGMLSVAETNDGALLVYARQDNGSARIFVRSAPRRSARKTSDTSARRGSR